MREEVEGALMGGGALCGGEIIMRAWQVLDEPVALISREPNKIGKQGEAEKKAREPPYTDHRLSEEKQ